MREPNLCILNRILYHIIFRQIDRVGRMLSDSWRLIGQARPIGVPCCVKVVGPKDAPDFADLARWSATLRSQAEEARRNSGEKSLRSSDRLSRAHRAPPVGVGQ